MWFNSIIMPLHLIIMPLNSIIMPRNIIIMLINIIFMPLHSIIVKTATRTHNNEYGQALKLTGFIHVTSHCFSINSFIFMSLIIHRWAYCGRTCLPNREKSGKAGLVRNWLRHVNNYKIIIIQSQHWIHLKRVRNNNNLTKL